MKKIESIDRDQIQLNSLNMLVDQHSMVRVIDVFLDFALSKDLGFKSTKQVTGRPAFPIRTLLGIYMYGYLNRIRSSRALAKACTINIEMMWLVKGHRPCYKTIANFRKDNRKPFRNLFAFYREFCLNLHLYGKQVVAIDGSKFRAQNSMKNNFNKKKIDRHLDYIDGKEKEYLDSLDQEDKESIHPRIDQLSKRKLKYQKLKLQLENSQHTQVSTTDPDARALPLHMRIVEVSYNLQSAVDDKHNLIVDYQITNNNDHRALAPMASNAKKALMLNDQDMLTVLADKGYHTGDQLQQCHDLNIDTIVAIPRKPKQTDSTKPAFLRKDKFIYNIDTDSYLCPHQQTLNKQARYKRKTRSGLPSAQFDRYTIKHSICIQCPHFKNCISKSNRKASQGRYIDRYLTDSAVQRNKITVQQNKDLYKKRQAIVEHPFGTIKRAWGFTHTLMKTIPKVETEFSIIMLCYNLRRTMSILGLENLKSALKSASLCFFNLTTIIRASVEKLFFYPHHFIYSIT